jgi:hypothetical protein
MSWRARLAARRCAAALALWPAAAVLPGCPGPEPSGPCGSDEGDPVLTLANRGDGAVLDDGVEVEIFLPPLGGVFTELDVTIDGLGQADLDFLHVVFERRDTGESLADVRYIGEVIPLMCTEDDDVLVVQYMPVGFTDPVVLAELDGVEATVIGTLETTHGDFSITHDVVLRAVEY